LISLSLLCTVVSTSPAPAGGAVADKSSHYTEVVLQGTALDASGAELLLRCRGQQIRVPLVPEASGTTAKASVPIASFLSSTSGAGGNSGTVAVVWAEVVRGAWLSPAKALLVVDDPMLAQEVSRL
jgi:hypothetical protein